MDLLNTVTHSLHIPEEQARAGIGLLFQSAKEQMPAQQFSQITEQMPDIDEFVSNAPEHSAFEDFLGKASSMFGTRATHMASMASLASGFSKAGMDKEVMAQMLPLVLKYIQDTGGVEARDAVDRVLH